jgi:hypothetical protein
VDAEHLTYDDKMKIRMKKAHNSCNAQMTSGWYEALKKYNIEEDDLCLFSFNKDEGRPVELLIVGLPAVAKEDDQEISYDQQISEDDQEVSEEQVLIEDGQEVSEDQEKIEDVQDNPDEDMEKIWRRGMSKNYNNCFQLENY